MYIKYELYRAKNGELFNAEMIEWVLVKSEDYIFDYSERIDIPYIIPIDNFNLKDYREYRVEEKTIGQFTGLYDKDKKPIYDGDIIDIHQTINGYNQFVIEYKDYGFSTKYYNQKENKAIRWYEYDLDELFDVNESEKEIEVIGNIHDKERE